MSGLGWGWINPLARILWGRFWIKFRKILRSARWWPVFPCVAGRCSLHMWQVVPVYYTEYKGEEELQWGSTALCEYDSWWWDVVILGRVGALVFIVQWRCLIGGARSIGEVYERWWGSVCIKLLAFLTTLSMSDFWSSCVSGGWPGKCECVVCHGLGD